MKYPLVMLSGLLCDDRAWRPVADLLSDTADCTLVSFENETSITAMARKVLDVAPPRFALAGHSMGGRVAIECWRLAPHRITGLGLFNTGVHATKPSEDDGRMSLVPKARDKGMAAMAEDWLPPMLGDNEDRVREVYPGLFSMICEQTPDSFEGQQRALLDRPDAEGVLPTVTVPTLLLSAHQDKWSPLDQHAEIQMRLGNRDENAPWTRLVGLDKAGHFAPVERPRGVAGAIADWLGVLSAPA